MKHQCPECQELRMAPLDPAVSLQRSETLWETMVMDNAEFPVDDKVIHCMIMMDEASRLVVPHFLFEHAKQESRNATANEVVGGIQETWVRHYGLPGQIRMDPEGAFRSTELGAWAEERGVHLLPCAAEAHGQIGVVERAIQTIKATARQLLQGAAVEAWEAIQQACTSHNELSRVEGYSPFQWAFGRQPTHIGQMHEKGYDLPFLTSSAVAGSSMATNLRLRVQAQQTFLRNQAQEQVTRALNTKTRRSENYVPGDLVFFKRIKPPAQPAAAARMPHKLWRWYGPGRVLATETRTDGAGEQRKPAHIVWIVTHGRLKRCAPEQLRHASERERLLAENSEAPATTWTFHSLAQTLYKGEFEILDQHVFPEDGQSEAPPRAPRRARSLSRTADRSSHDSKPKMARNQMTPQDIVGNPSGDGGARQRATEENKTLQDLVNEDIAGERAHQKGKSKTGNKMQEHKESQSSNRERSRPRATSSHTHIHTSSEAQSGDRSQGLDLGRYLHDPMYSPAPSAVGHNRPTHELFQQPLFKKQRKELYGIEDDAELFVGMTTSDNTVAADRLVCTLDIDLPERQSDWRRMRRSPGSYFVKKVRSAEVKWHLLSPEEKAKFEVAKEAEVSQWLAANAVKRITGVVPKGRTIGMRWVLTWKENGSAKGRIVLIGFQDPDLQTMNSSAPTMSRRTRQLGLQTSSIRRWRVLKADVKAAFLQGEEVETARNLFAIPVPELAKALNMQPNEVVQIQKSCYGLVNAPASWFECVRKTLATVGFRQCKTDPCLWVLPDLKTGKGILGYICAHVDDFLISGDEESDEWADALTAFHARFKWSPWEFSSFSHCGVKIREEPDFSFTLDHASFCENIEQVVFQGRADHEPLRGEEMTQLRGALGALQWRAHQTGPHLSARLGQLQSEISKATVATAKATNKLIRECFNTRHISTKINQLFVDDPEKMVFVAWSDAALANRIDLGSTGGYLIAAANPDILTGTCAPLTCVSWRSSKLQRKARSSLSAEAQALSEAENELMYTRLAWCELCGMEVDLKAPELSIQKISGTLVIDAKSLYDIVQKKDLNSAAFGLRDKHISLEVMCLLEAIQRLKTDVRWVHSEAQLADGLTKPLPPGILHKVLLEGRWTLMYDPNFTSAKKLRAAKKTIFNQELRGVSVSESEQPQTLDHEMLTVGFHWSSWHKPTTDHRAPFCHVRVELTPLRYVVKQLTWVIAGIFDTGCVASLIGDINNYWFGTIPYPHWSLPLSEPREPVAPGCYQHPPQWLKFANQGCASSWTLFWTTFVQSIP